MQKSATEISYRPIVTLYVQDVIECPSTKVWKRQYLLEKRISGIRYHIAYYIELILAFTLCNILPRASIAVTLNQ